MNAIAPDHARIIRRLRFLIALFITGLVLSGVTAIPLETELRWLTNITGARQLVEAPASTAAPEWAVWLVKVETALRDTNTRYPFIGYGGDWLAFGHFMIALVFVWAWRDPVRNRWLYDFGLLACVLVIPYALIMGGVRGIPMWWRARRRNSSAITVTEFHPVSSPAKVQLAAGNFLPFNLALWPRSSSLMTKSPWCRW